MTKRKPKTKSKNKRIFIIAGLLIASITVGTYLTLSAIGKNRSNTPATGSSTNNTPEGVSDKFNDATNTSVSAEKLAKEGKTDEAISRYKESARLYREAGDNASAGTIDSIVDSLENPLNSNKVEADF